MKKKKIGYKVGQKSAPSSVSAHFFSPSLFVVLVASQRHHKLVRHNLHHKPLAQPLAAHREPPPLASSLSLLQSCFFFFLPLPPTTNSSINAATNLTSAPPRQDQLDLQLGTPMLCSAAHQLLQLGCCIQNENSLCMEHN